MEKGTLRILCPSNASPHAAVQKSPQVVRCQSSSIKRDLETGYPGQQCISWEAGLQ